MEIPKSARLHEWVPGMITAPNYRYKDGKRFGEPTSFMVAFQFKTEAEAWEFSEACMKEQETANG